MNYQSTHLVKTIQESATLKLSARAKALKAEGRSIVNFGAGEPDFNTDLTVIEKAFAKTKEGATKYTAVPGTPAARDAVAERISKDYGFSVERDEVLLSTGGKQAIYHALQALVEPGEEVLIPSPYWVSFPDMVKLVGGVPKFLPTDEEGVKLSILDQALTSKTKALILNSPSNPSGMLWSEARLKELGKFLKEKGLWLMSDDTYYRLVYPPHQFKSIVSLEPGLREQTVIIGSSSKSYAMTGWRLGWAIGPKPLIKDMAKLQGQVTSCPSSISQSALEVAVLERDSVCEDFLKIFDTRRKLMLDLLSKIEGLEWVDPKGAFYIFVRVSGRMKGRSVSDWSMQLLEKHGVCVIPGEPFGAPEYIRLSYALGEDAIREGISRIKEALA